MSKITDSARQKECSIRIPRVCNWDKDTTVWAHANGSAAGKGIGMKSLDPLGAYACSDCHDCYDRRSRPPPGWTYDDVRLAFWEGHARSLRILIDEGLVKC